MEDNIEQEEIKPLTFNYVFHLILFILIFLLHLIISTKLYWVYKAYYKIFLFCIYFGILYFIFPIYPMFIICLKKFKEKIFQFLKKLTLAFLIISIIIGLLVSAIILVNTISSKTFCKECPFSITLSHLNYLFGEFYDKSPSDDEIKDLCKSRRCILDEIKSDNEKYPYKYLCNYNPYFEFDESDTIYKRKTLTGEEITSEKQFKCDLVGVSFYSLGLKHNELNKYLSLCYYLNDFYYCGRFDKPGKEYKIDNGDSCPDLSYLLLLYILCVLVILIDIVITILPWGVEYISLKRIVRIMMNMTRRKPNSHNSTQKSSVITNNEESFKKSKTLEIVFPSNNENNEEDIATVTRKKLCIKDGDTINSEENRIEENRNEIKEIKIVQNSDRNKLNSSINVVGKNESNDINDKI